MKSSPQARFFEISYSITRILSDARDSSVAVLSVLQVLGKNLGWDLGVFWIVDGSHFVLKCTHVWNPSREPGFRQFEQVTRSRQFAVGEGLPGQAWNIRKAVWASYIRSRQLNFPRASVAEAAALTTGVAVPLYVASRVLGVLELFSTKLIPEDEDLLDFLHAVGGQIGVFLEHSRLKADVKQLDAQLKLLAETSSDAVFTIDEGSNILYASSATEMLLGYKPEELIGKRLTVIMPKRFHAQHAHGVQRYIETGKRHITRDGVALAACRKDGTEVQVTISFGEFFRGGKRVFTGFLRKQ